MKLRMLALAAGFAMLPVIAGAQTPTDTTKKDTTTMAPAPTTTTTTDTSTGTMSMSSGTSRAVKDSTPGPHPEPPGDGTTCPWGCPTSKGTAGLTGPQFLALQQELRDRHCGNSHVTGRLDAATRIAIRNCAKKMGVANNAGAVLVAFDVGYSSADVNTSGSGTEE
jgi:hypothetical protein